MLKLVVKRKPRGGNFLQKLNADVMDCARVTEIQAHPIGSSKWLIASIVRRFSRNARICNADTMSGGSVLRFPGERVIVAVVPKMQKASDGHQRVQGRFKLLLNRDR